MLEDITSFKIETALFIVTKLQNFGDKNVSGYNFFQNVRAKFILTIMDYTGLINVKRKTKKIVIQGYSIIMYHCLRVVRKLRTILRIAQSYCHVYVRTHGETKKLQNSNADC
jgi:hypothetical protein